MPSPFIFVTDDDQTYVELIKDLLTDAGYARVVWHVGNNAFQCIRDEQPDLVLLVLICSIPGAAGEPLTPCGSTQEPAPSR